MKFKGAAPRGVTKINVPSSPWAGNTYDQGKNYADGGYVEKGMGYADGGKVNTFRSAAEKGVDILYGPTKGKVTGRDVTPKKKPQAGGPSKRAQKIREALGE